MESTDKNYNLLHLLKMYYRADRRRIHIEDAIQKHENAVSYAHNPEYHGMDGLLDAINGTELLLVTLSVKIDALIGEEDGGEEDA